MGLTIAVLLAGSAAIAQAGPLPLDPNAIGGVYQGSQVFQNKGGPSTLTVNVEFAVYAPGQFNLSFPGSDPSLGSQYVYAYEAFNLNVTPFPRTLAIFTVGLKDGAQAANVGAQPILTDPLALPPASSSFGGTPPNAARWDFTGQVIPVGRNSQILLYTSPHPPTFVTSSVIGGGLADSKNLPSPIPEPASWVLLGIGSVALAYRRIRARLG